MEQKIGDIFEHENVKLMVVEDKFNDCSECYFFGKNCIAEKCLLTQREDKKDVIFKEVN